MKFTAFGRKWIVETPRQRYQRHVTQRLMALYDGTASYKPRTDAEWHSQRVRLTALEDAMDAVKACAR